MRIWRKPSSSSDLECVQVHRQRHDRGVVSMGGCHLTVQDTGMGIPDAECAACSSASIGSNDADSTKDRDGLALVKELVGLHQGSVDVASVLGQGTVFTVCLPLGDAHLPKERVTSGHVRRSKMHGAEAFVQEALRWLPSANDDDELNRRRRKTLHRFPPRSERESSWSTTIDMRNLFVTRSPPSTRSKPRSMASKRWR